MMHWQWQLPFAYEMMLKSLNIVNWFKPNKTFGSYHLYSYSKTKQILAKFTRLMPGLSSISDDTADIGRIDRIRLTKSKSINKII